MSFLKEIAVKAKWEGSFTERWTIIRSCLLREGCFKGIRGKSDIQNLKDWAEAQGLFMDFEVEVGGFCSEIRTVTLGSGLPAVRDVGAGPPRPAEEAASPEVAGVASEAAAQSDAGSTSAEGTDRAEDNDPWADLSGDIDCAVIGRVAEQGAEVVANA